MDANGPQPELFVARDRARRFARYLREALQERRLFYRGADVGMTTLTNEGDEALAAVVEDARQTAARLVEGGLRDRERGYMEVPLVLAAESLVDRVELARRLDRAAALAPGGLDVREARAAVLVLLEEALQRLDAYCGAYDEKRPAGPARQTDLAHLVRSIERDAAWSGRVAGAHGEPPAAFDREPPPILSDPTALEDLLRAARAALGPVPGPWRVRPGGPGRPLELALGRTRAGAVSLPVPARLERAVQVLAFLHPVAAACLGRPATETQGGGLLSPAPEAAAPVVEEVRLRLSDEAAGGLELVVAAAAGPGATLDAAAEGAVRALLQSPPVTEAGPPSPQRLVALMGLMKALDASLERRILPRAGSNACRVAASRLPRETTRKARLRRSARAALEAAFPRFPAHRLEAVAQDLADGQLGARHAVPADAAVILALVGRSWQTCRCAMDLAPLDATDVEAVVRDLCDVADVRRDLERGADVEPARVTRLEQAAIAALGRLGRLAPA